MYAPPIQWLLEAAAKRPERSAIQFSDADWSYERLADEVLRTASALTSRGLNPGQRLGLVFGAGPACVTSLLGTLAAGIVAVPLSPLLTPREIESHIRRNNLAAMLTDPSNARSCSAAMAQAALNKPVLTIGAGDFGEDIATEIENSAPDSAADVDSDDIALILHTAGSTGRSKLVPRKHRHIAAECDSVSRSLEISDEDVIFGILPLYHCHGLFNCLFAALRAQCKLSLFHDSRPFVLAREDILAAIARDRATILPSIPFQLERLVSAPGTFDLSSLRLCFSGGATLKAQTFIDFSERFGIQIRQQYGCTEAGALTLNLDEDVAKSHTTAGGALEGIEVSIVDADTSGEGEIFVRSAALTDGYERAQEIDDAAFVDGGFRTGDLGRLDDAGRLIVTRRRPIYIDVAGHKVDSSEIEDVLNELPGVRETMVVATDSGPPGMKAVIACDSPLDTRFVRNFCRERLASYKVPSVFEYPSSLPLNEHGKRSWRPEL